MLTPYQFASNTPIVAIDLDGLEAVFPQPDKGTKSVIKVDYSTITKSYNPGQHVFPQPPPSLYTFKQYNVSHSFDDVKTHVKYDADPNYGMSVGNFGSQFPVKAMRARSISETISGIGYHESDISVLNTFEDFIAPQIFNSDALGEKEFDRLRRDDLSQGYGKVFRHLVWQSVMTHLYGEQFAEDMGNANEFANIMGDNEEKRKHSFRDLINNEYGRIIGENFDGDLNNPHDLTRLLNDVSEQVISSFPELSSVITEDKRRPFTEESGGVQLLLDQIEK